MGVRERLAEINRNPILRLPTGPRPRSEVAQTALERWHPQDRKPLELSCTVAPAISGSHNVVGATLSCTTGTWSSNATISSYTYQWRRDGVDISGATASTRVLLAADVGPSITCVVTAHTVGGTASAASNALQATIASALGAKLLNDWADGTSYTAGDWLAGATHLTNATGAQQPSASTEGSRACLSLDGGDHLTSSVFLSTRAAAGTSYGVTAVVRPNSRPAHGAAPGYEGAPLFRAQTSAQNWFTYDDAGTYFGLYDGTDFAYAKAQAPTANGLVRVRGLFTGAGGAGALRVQCGSEVEQGATVEAVADQANRDVTFGFGDSSASGYPGTVSGKVCQVILHRDLTAAEKASVDAILAYRWSGVEV